MPPSSVLSSTFDKSNQNFQGIGEVKVVEKFSQGAQERYLGHFMSQFVFRASFVYITNQRLIVKKSKAWVMTWFVHLVFGGVAGILLTSLGTLFGLGVLLMAVALVGAGLNRLGLCRRGGCLFVSHPYEG